MKILQVNKKLISNTQFEILEKGKSIKIPKIGKVKKYCSQNNVREGFVRVFL